MVCIEVLDKIFERLQSVKPPSPFKNSSHTKLDLDSFARECAEALPDEIKDIRIGYQFCEAESPVEFLVNQSRHVLYIPLPADNDPDYFGSLVLNTYESTVRFLIKHALNTEIQVAEKLEERNQWGLEDDQDILVRQVRDLYFGNSRVLDVIGNIYRSRSNAQSVLMSLSSLVIEGQSVILRANECIQPGFSSEATTYPDYANIPYHFYSNARIEFAEVMVLGGNDSTPMYIDILKLFVTEALWYGYQKHNKSMLSPKVSHPKFDMKYRKHGPRNLYPDIRQSNTGEYIASLVILPEVLQLR